MKEKLVISLPAKKKKKKKTRCLTLRGEGGTSRKSVVGQSAETPAVHKREIVGGGATALLRLCSRGPPGNHHQNKEKGVRGIKELKVQELGQSRKDRSPDREIISKGWKSGKNRPTLASYPRRSSPLKFKERTRTEKA